MIVRLEISAGCGNECWRGVGVSQWHGDGVDVEANGLGAGIGGDGDAGGDAGGIGAPTIFTRIHVRVYESVSHFSSDHHARGRTLV